MLDSRTKVGLPLFFIDLEPSKSNKKIFLLNKSVGPKIMIEHLKKKGYIIQYHKCQEYYNTQKFWKNKPKCVKCGCIHLTNECKKSRQVAAEICAKCNGDYPAKYRGSFANKKMCSVRRKIISHLLPPKVDDVAEFPGSPCNYIFWFENPFLSYCNISF